MTEMLTKEEALQLKAKILPSLLKKIDRRQQLVLTMWATLYLCPNGMPINQLAFALNNNPDIPFAVTELKEWLLAESEKAVKEGTIVLTNGIYKLSPEKRQEMKTKANSLGIHV